jgi:hypothetical protein
MRGLVSGQRSIVVAVLGLWLAGVLGAPARAVDVRSDLSLLGQVRQDDQTRQTRSPQDIYGDMGVAGLPGNSSADTYFRLEHDFGSNQGPTELYDAYLRIPEPGAEFTLGRQFLSEVPGAVFVADGGKARFDAGPVALTVFGGLPRYFEPTYSSELQSQDEFVFGGSLRTTHLRNGYLSIGYLQQERDVPPPSTAPTLPAGFPQPESEERVLRQLVTAAGARTFPTLPGMPNLYSSVAFDAKRQNIDQGTAGFDVFLVHPRLSFNFESSYYKPQDQGERVQPNINLREDAIFELFSVSQMMQFRGGLRYALTPSLSAYGDYSYQRYEQLDTSYVNGHIGSAGLLWLPGGDGLEVVQFEYYLLDSSGGNVNGGRLYYESRVYKRILFRTRVDVGYYKKASNESSVPVSTLLGLGYAFTPSLVGELDFEALRNKRFNQDYIFDFMLSYKFHAGSKKPAADRIGAREMPS